MRLIDADVLMPNAECKGRYNTVNAYDIVNCPTVDAEPIRHGYWLPVTDWGREPKVTTAMIMHYRCSNCKLYFQRLSPYHYCPNCGSKNEVKE